MQIETRVTRLNSVTHNGKVIMFGTNGEGQLVYRALEKEEIAAAHTDGLWQLLPPNQAENDPSCLALQDEVLADNQGNALLRFIYAPTELGTTLGTVQLFSTGTVIFLFRITSEGRVVVGRYLWSKSRNLLVPCLEERRLPQRTRFSSDQSGRLAAFDDTPTPFYAPQIELSFLPKLVEPWLGVTRTAAADGCFLWHLFFVDQEGRLNCQSIRQGGAAGFQLLDDKAPAITRRIMELDGLTPSGAPVAMAYVRPDGAARVLLALPAVRDGATHPYTALLHFAVSADGHLTRLIQLPDRTEVLKGVFQYPAMPADLMEQLNVEGADPLTAETEQILVAEPLPMTPVDPKQAYARTLTVIATAGDKQVLADDGMLRIAIDGQGHLQAQTTLSDGQTLTRRDPQPLPQGGETPYQVTLAYDPSRGGITSLSLSRDGLPLGHLSPGLFQFDGVDDYLEVAPHPNPTGAITLSLWARAAEPTWHASGCFVSKRDAFIFSPIKGTRDVCVFIHSGSSWGRYPDVTVNKVEDWHHYAFTFDTTSFCFYLDGVLVLKTAGKGAMAADDGRLTIGWDEDQVDQFFKGFLTDVRCIGRALDEAEIAASMFQPPQQEQLLGWWPINENARDQSAQAHSSQFHGDPQAVVAAVSAVPGTGEATIPVTSGEGTATAGTGSAGEGDGAQVSPIDPSLYPSTEGGPTHLMGGRLYFNGADTTVLIEPFENPTPTLTAAMWTRCDDPTWNASGCCFSKRDAFVLSPQAGTTLLRVDIAQADGSYHRYPDIDVGDTSAWHHLAFTLNEHLLKVYVDGEKRLETAAVATINSDPGQAFIGHDEGLNNRYFKGYLSDVRLYAKVLEEAEIPALLTTSPSSDDPDLVGYWPLNADVLDKAAAHPSKLLGVGPIVPTHEPIDLKEAERLMAERLGPNRYYFDGVDDYLQTPAFPNPSEALTFSCWARPESELWHSTGSLMSKRNAFILCPWVDARTVWAYLWVGGWRHVDMAPPDITGWHHYAATYDGAVFRIYFDGKQSAELPLSGAVDVDEESLYLGWDDQLEGRFFKGWLCDARIYDRALSAEEVAASLSEAPDPNGLIGYWPMDGRPDDPIDPSRSATVHGQPAVVSAGEAHPGLDLPGPLALPAPADGQPGALVIQGNGPSRLDECYYLDGVSAWLETPPWENPTDALTCSIWAKSETATWNHYGNLLSKRKAFILSPWKDTRSFRFYIFHGDWRYVSFDGLPPLEGWHHYAGSFDGQTLRFFLDGHLRAEVAYAGSIGADNGPMLIGNDDDLLDRAYKGWLCDARVYGRALSEAEIQAAMLAPPAEDDPHLLGYWPMDGRPDDPIDARRTALAHGNITSQAREALYPVPLEGEGNKLQMWPGNLVQAQISETLNDSQRIVAAWSLADYQGEAQVADSHGQTYPAILQNNQIHALTNPDSGEVKLTSATQPVDEGTYELVFDFDVMGAPLGFDPNDVDGQPLFRFTLEGKDAAGDTSPLAGTHPYDFAELSDGWWRASCSLEVTAPTTEITPFALTLQAGGPWQSLKIRQPSLRLVEAVISRLVYTEEPELPILRARTENSQKQFANLTAETAEIIQRRRETTRLEESIAVKQNKPQYNSEKTELEALLQNAPQDGRLDAQRLRLHRLCAMLEDPTTLGDIKKQHADRSAELDKLWASWQRRQSALSKTLSEENPALVLAQMEGSPANEPVKAGLLMFAEPTGMLETSQTAEGDACLSFFDREGRMRTLYLDQQDQLTDRNPTRAQDAAATSALLTSAQGSAALDQTLTLDNPWTVETWFHYPPLVREPGETQYLVAAKEGDDGPLVIQAGQLGSVVGGVFAGSGIQLDNRLCDGWHHVAAIGNGGETQFLLDAGQPNGTASAQFKGEIGFLGNRADGTHPMGLMGETAVWNVALEERTAPYRAMARLKGDEPGLVSYWPLADVGETDLKARGAHPVTATPGGSAGLVPVELPVGNPFTGVGAFDGHSKIESADELDLGEQSFTVEFWARHTGAGTASWILSLGEPQKDAGLHLGFRPNNKFSFSLFGNDLNNRKSLKDKHWHHYACTYDFPNNKQAVYIDGALACDRVAPTPFTGKGKLNIGQTGWSGRPGNFVGELTEVRIWDHVRNPGQVVRNQHHRLSGEEQGLTLYWPLNPFTQGDSTVPDLAGNNPGTAEGVIGLRGTEPPLAPAGELITATAATPFDPPERALLQPFRAFSGGRGLTLLPEIETEKPFDEILAPDLVPLSEEEQRKEVPAEQLAFAEEGTVLSVSPVSPPPEGGSAYVRGNARNNLGLFEGPYPAFNPEPVYTRPAAPRPANNLGLFEGPYPEPMYGEAGQAIFDVANNLGLFEGPYPEEQVAESHWPSPQPAGVPNNLGLFEGPYPEPMPTGESTSSPGTTTGTTGHHGTGTGTTTGTTGHHGTGTGTGTTGVSGSGANSGSGAPFPAMGGDDMPDFTFMFDWFCPFGEQLSHMAELPLKTMEHLVDSSVGLMETMLNSSPTNPPPPSSPSKSKP